MWYFFKPTTDHGLDEAIKFHDIRHRAPTIGRSLTNSYSTEVTSRTRLKTCFTAPHSSSKFLFHQVKQTADGLPRMMTLPVTPRTNKTACSLMHGSPIGYWLCAVGAAAAAAARGSVITRSHRTHTPERWRNRLWALWTEESLDTRNALHSRTKTLIDQQSDYLPATTRMMNSVQRNGARRTVSQWLAGNISPSASFHSRKISRVPHVCEIGHKDGTKYTRESCRRQSFYSEMKHRSESCRKRSRMYMTYQLNGDH